MAAATTLDLGTAAVGREDLAVERSAGMRERVTMIRFAGRGLSLCAMATDCGPRRVDLWPRLDTPASLSARLGSASGCSWRSENALDPADAEGLNCCLMSKQALSPPWSKEHEAIRVVRLGVSYLELATGIFLLGTAGFAFVMVALKPGHGAPYVVLAAGMLTLIGVLLLVGTAALRRRHPLWWIPHLLLGILMVLVMR